MASLLNEFSLRTTPAAESLTARLTFELSMHSRPDGLELSSSAGVISEDASKDKTLKEDDRKKMLRLRTLRTIPSRRSR